MLISHVRCMRQAGGTSVSLGKVRQAQIISTYGPGSLIPVGEESFMVAGTDFWFGMGEPNPEEIFHEARLEKHLGVQRFVRPPSSEEDGAKDVPLIRFPKWYSCLSCSRLNTFARSADADGLCATCGGKLAPSRFISICDSGHASDFPYSRWVHQGDEGPGEHALFLKNEGKSAGLSDIVVSCRCGRSRNLQGALGKNALKTISKCFGDRAWLPTPNAEECDKTPRGTQRGASGVWQASTASSISIPPWSGEANRFVDRYWGVLGVIPEAALRETLEGMIANHPLPGGVDEALAAVANRKQLQNGLEIEESTMRRQEYDALRRVTPATENNRDFVCQKPTTSEQIPIEFSRLHLISRLREVRALKGFNRLTNSESTEIVEAKLSTAHKNWLPAIEVSGEGLFIEFEIGRIQAWESDERVLQRAQRLSSKLEKNALTAELPAVTPRLLLVHTFAHALIDQWSLECGYPSSSLRERIYVDDEMAGILIYTATSDSQGSLGGIIGMAKGGRFIKSFTEALQRSSWCSNDPLCIESGPNGFANANLGACHACALLSETSCEMRNLLLDRGMVIGAPDGCPGFFSSQLS